MGLFKKSEKQLQIAELEKRFNDLKTQASNHNLTDEEIAKYNEELQEINKEIESLLS